MGRPIKNEVGNVYGELTVISLSEFVSPGPAFWDCICSCGNTVSIPGYSLRRGDFKSCGCKQGIKSNGHGGNFIDETGKRYGKLVVLEEHGQYAHCVKWVCKCDCGNITYVTGSSLRAGQTKSCGCIVRLPKGVSGFNTVYRRYRNQASERNYSWNLSKEEFAEIISKPCFYCGAEPDQCSRGRRSNGGFIYNGVDRLNNSIGYEINNVVPCCGVCNRMKSDATLDGFKNKIVDIYNRIISSHF